MKQYILSVMMLLSLTVINKATFAAEIGIVPPVEKTEAAVVPAEEVVIDEEDETVKTEESVPSKIDTK